MEDITVTDATCNHLGASAIQTYTIAQYRPRALVGVFVPVTGFCRTVAPVQVEVQKGRGTSERPPRDDGVDSEGNTTDGDQFLLPKAVVL
jgi:hypothetical protein